MAKYYYYDNRGGEYCTTTETTTIAYESGEQFMDMIREGGDHTTCKKQVMQAKALGIGR